MLVKNAYYAQVERKSRRNSTKKVETPKNLLLKAIDKAQNDRLRIVLKNILNKHGQLAEEWLKEELLVPQSAVSQRKEDNIGSDDIEMEGNDEQPMRLGSSSLTQNLRTSISYLGSISFRSATSIPLCHMRELF
jgi:hypothetical protein